MMIEIILYNQEQISTSEQETEIRHLMFIIKIIQIDKEVLLKNKKHTKSIQDYDKLKYDYKELVHKKEKSKKQRERKMRSFSTI